MTKEKKERKERKKCTEMDRDESIENGFDI